MAEHDDDHDDDHDAAAPRTLTVEEAIRLLALHPQGAVACVVALSLRRMRDHDLTHIERHGAAFVVWVTSRRTGQCSSVTVDVQDTSAAAFCDAVRRGTVRPVVDEVGNATIWGTGSTGGTGGTGGEGEP